MAKEKLFKVIPPTSDHSRHRVRADVFNQEFALVGEYSGKDLADLVCETLNRSVSAYIEYLACAAAKEVKSAEKPISESVKAIVDAYFSNFHKHAANFVVEAESKLKLSGNSHAFMFSGSSWHPNMTLPLPCFPPQPLDFMPSLSDLYAGVNPEELEAFKKLTAEYLEAAMDIRNKMLKAREDAAAESQQSATVPPFQPLPHPHFNYDSRK